MAGSVSPARCPPCGNHRWSIVRLSGLHRRAESEPSGCARGDSELHHCGGGRHPRTWYIRRGQAQPGRYNRVGPRPGLGRRGAKEQNRGRGGPTSASWPLRASLATGLDLFHSERGRLWVFARWAGRAGCAAGPWSWPPAVAAAAAETPPPPKTSSDAAAMESVPRVEPGSGAPAGKPGAIRERARREAE